MELFHITQLPRIPDEPSTRRLRKEIELLSSEDAAEIKSIAITLSSHTIRVPREALRYWLDIHNANLKLPTLRDAHDWLWKYLRNDNSVHVCALLVLT